MEWNPLLDLSRNTKCPCGSGRKFKSCHLPMLPQAVTKAEADTYRQALHGFRNNIVFTSKENKDAK